MHSIDEQDKHVSRIQLLCVILIIAFSFGLWLHLPYMLGELRRLEPWKIAGLMAGDIAALLWFLRFAFVHAGLGVPLHEISVTDARRQFKRLAIAVAIAVLFDLCFSLYLMYDAKIGYPKAIVTDAR